ncbi:hypothetical protein [Shouchella clausii]|uniref:hypothetical protein n=1 Tax=Shouchella clausii TaxID=79880 RepID=UPI001C73B75E|nr:hypothetical protein [Shouchella clausii]MBX0319760.1 hypothetical protein [Shouchella clausii]
MEKWKDDIPLFTGIKGNPDGTFTGYFFNADGNPPATKIYASKEEFEKNKDKDRIELMQMNQ